MARSYNKQQRYDWERIKTEYITTDASYRNIIEKYGMSYSTLQHKASEEKWADQKREYALEAAKKSLDACSDQEAERWKRIYRIGDTILDKIEEGLEAVHLQVVRNKTKTKTITYDNSIAKPVKEVVEEIETADTVDCGVDALALKQLSDTLRNIKEIQALRDELSRREAEARISKMEKDAGLNAEEGETGVILLPDIVESDLHE